MAKSLEQLEKENKQQRAMLKELTQELKVANAVAPKNAKPVVTLDGEPYRLRAGERTARGITSLADLAKDTRRLKELRDAGSDLLEKVIIK